MEQILGIYFVKLMIRQVVEVSPESAWEEDDLVEHVRANGKMVDWDIENTHGHDD
jgi:hypothetical protein